MLQKKLKSNVFAINDTQDNNLPYRDAAIHVPLGPHMEIADNDKARAVLRAGGPHKMRDDDKVYFFAEPCTIFR